jgi:predicted transcriptional regulator of viral defense system
MICGGSATSWTTILTTEARSNCVLRLQELSRKYERSEPVIRNSLRRYEQKGLVERVSAKLYINHLNQQSSPQNLVNNIRPKSYVSLESALVEKGIINQSPSALTCVGPAHSQSYHSKSANIVYRKISSDLYWGYEEKATRYNRYLIAEPEKAVLDWIYLNRQEGLPTPLDEFQLSFLSIPKRRKYADRFPRTVQDTVKDLLLERAFPSETADQHHRRDRAPIA